MARLGREANPGPCPLPLEADISPRRLSIWSSQSLTNSGQRDIVQCGAGGPGMQFDQPKRREFMTLLGGAAIAWPLAARAQQQLPVIGILSSRSRATDALLIAVIREGLN